MQEANNCLRGPGNGLSSSPQGVNCGTTLQPSGNMRVMSFGEKCVGLTFNPSGDKKVEKVKRLYAEIIDLIMEERLETISSRKNELKEKATMEAITAQMWAIKAITFNF